MKDPAEIFGRGMAFPIRVGADGHIAWSTGAENVRENIRVLLLTGRSERVMLPEYGAGLQQFLFEPNVPSTHRAIHDAIVEALQRYEPRIALESVQVDAAPDDPRAATAVIQYRLIATRAVERIGLRIDVAR